MGINWTGYSQESFDNAKAENKPVFMMITAVWCHWCHVYHEQTLDDTAVIEYLNEHFIAIYVDADKRQDLTRQYMEGGWPYTMLFNPNGEQVFSFNGHMPKDKLLLLLTKVVQRKNDAVEFHKGAVKEKVNIKKYSREELKTAYAKMRQNFINAAKQNYDAPLGGFGSDQKFPMAPTIDYLIEEYRQSRSQALLQIITGTLDGAMNLYDTVDGGFYRYATQRDWTSPHYEKMLDVNTQLIDVYARMGKLGVTKRYEEIAKKAANYVTENLYDKKSGGFYGSQDAKEEYYETRQGEKPTVDKTKYAEWNGEAITHFLKSGLKTIEALQSLNFILGKMTTTDGILHYNDDTGSHIDGQLIDNVWVLMALIAANHEHAGELADFIVERFYDEKSGAFIERKSKTQGAYRKDEVVLEDKLPGSNGLVAYCLLKLGKHVDKAETALAYFVNDSVNFGEGTYLLNASMLL